MTSAMAALGIAAAATSAICYALLTRAEKIRRNRRPTSGNPTDGGSSLDSDGWAITGWFGGHHSATDSSATRLTSAAVISAAAIAGGGGDGGGGDGGGGGD